MARIKSKGYLSSKSYHNRSIGGQKYWWLRNVASGEFIAIDEVRGDDYLDIEIDLKPGRYQIGCGPKGDYGVREIITIKPAPVARLPLCPTTLPGIGDARL